MRVLLAVAVLMIVAACQAAPPEGLMDADRAAIDEVTANYQATTLAGDIDAWVELWTTDAEYQVPEAPTLVGRGQIRADMELFPTPRNLSTRMRHFRLEFSEHRPGGSPPFLA